MKAIGRLGLVVGAWLGLYVLVGAAIRLAGAASRAAGKDPQLHDDGWPDVKHLRRVDGKLLCGAQPSLAQYAGLADHGVTRVVDLRGPQPYDQARRDDPAALADLGLEHTAVPATDGHTPTPDQVRRFLDLVDGADGRVFAHCGGGVGRSTSFAAAYEAAQGRDPSVLEQVAVGPPTLEQIWFVATLRPGRPEYQVGPVVAAASRLVDAPRTLWGYLNSLT